MKACRHFLFFTFAILMSWIAPCHAALYTTSYGTLLTGVSNCDDCFESQIDFSGASQNINFFGSVYSGVFVSPNGYVTFGAGSGSYTPTALDVQIIGPMIAGQYTDLDSRSDAASNVYINTSTPGELIVTWENMGHYPLNYTVRSTFQLVIRSSQFLVPQGQGQIGFFFGSITDTARAAAGFGDGLSTRNLGEQSLYDGPANAYSNHAPIWFNINAGTPTLAPICTLTAFPASIVQGGSSTLIASCNPTATAYSWTGGTCAGTSGTNCTVTPLTLGATTYTVSGSNAGGAGNIASATVTVTAPATLPPTITSVSPSSGAAGTLITITGTNLTGATVTIGGAAAIINSGNATFMTVVVPTLAAVGVGNLVVTTATAPSTAIPFVVTAPAGTLPNCTLTANPASIALGSSSTLSASCSPAAASFVWTGGACAGTTGASCTVTPSTVGTTTYTVRGSSAAGAGNIASATVTVTSAVTPVLFCVLTASSTSINPGGSSTLTTSCNTPASFFSWTGGSCAGTTAATCVVRPSATSTYNVTASNGSTIYTANATVMVTPAATSPVCTMIVSPSAITAGRSATLTASCTPDASAFSWTGGTCVGTIGATCVVTPTLTTTYTVRGSNAIGIGNIASGTVTIVPPVFPLTVTSNITPLLATVTATIQFRPIDAGTRGNVYVFALAPANLVSGIPTGALNEHKGPVTRGINTADTPTACVLAQIISGELKFATQSTLQAHLTNVLGSQNISVGILNGVSTAQVGGAIFYVGYGTDPNTMIVNGTSQNVLTLPGSNACQPETPQSGWWWYPLQDGRGFGIEVQGNNMFMSGYLYDASGRATWMVAEGKVSIDGSLFSSELYQVENGQTLTGAYKKPAISGRPGSITLSFTNSRSGTLIWPGGIIPIQRFDDVIGSGNGVAPSFVPENGWWWNESESGRGYFMEFKNNYAFIAGYMYEANGSPVWYLAEGRMATPQTFSSSWYQAGNGQTLTGPYKKPTIVNSNVGSISIQFQSATTATLTLPTGRLLAITRQRY